MIEWLWAKLKGGLDYLADLVLWAGQFIVDSIVGLFAWLWELVRGGFQYVAETVWESVQAVWSVWTPFAYQLVRAVMDWVISTAMGLLPSLPWDDLKSGFESLLEVLRMADWFIPLQTMVGIVAASYAVVVGVRATRWVISIITLGGG
jgi:hypothetical protein